MKILDNIESVEVFESSSNIYLLLYDNTAENIGKIQLTRKAAAELAREIISALE